MTSLPPRFPPYPIREVRVLHRRQNCGPQFADVTVDFEPASEGFAFEVAEGLTVEYEPAEDLPRFFAATAAGIEEQLSLHGPDVVTATRVVLRRARADAFGSHERAFKVAGYLAAREAWSRIGVSGH
ncbi:hypothetical protein CTZ27_28340 [Streptomyces griseocarneus]|nr:hypothetical protein CTZ27_28340 [Streptomyces griseocarneus]